MKKRATVRVFHNIIMYKYEKIRRLISEVVKLEQSHSIGEEEF